MVCGTFTRTKVPAADVQNVIDAYKENDPPPTSVISKADGAGTFTVVATWPDCPANTTHSLAGSKAR
jgi:hypothetical protein